MNDRQREQDTLFIAHIAATNGTGIVNSSGHLLGRNTKRIGFDSICRPFFDLLRKDWSRNRIVLKLRKPFYAIPLRKRQAGSIVIHLLVMSFAASYLTLAVLSTSNARKYWWQFAVIVLVLSIIGLIIPQGRGRNGR